MSSALIAAFVIVLLCESARLWFSGYARRRVLAPLLCGRLHREAYTWFYRAPRWTFPMAVLAWLASINIVGHLFDDLPSDRMSVHHVQGMVASHLLFVAILASIRLIGEATAGSRSAKPLSPNGGRGPTSGAHAGRWSTDPAAWPPTDEPVGDVRTGAARETVADVEASPATPATAKPRADSPSGSSRRRRLRARRWLFLGCAVARGAQVFLAAALPVALVRAATLPMITPDTQHKLLQLLRERDPETLFWVFVAAGITAPLAEELLFRVVIQTGLARWLGVRAAIVTTSLLFAALHGLPDAFALFPLALLLGTGYAATGRFLVPFTAHVLFNVTNLLLAAVAMP